MKDRVRPTSFIMEIRRNARRTYYIELSMLPYNIHLIVKREKIEDLKSIHRMESEGYRYEAIEIPRPAGVG